MTGKIETRFKQLFTHYTVQSSGCSKCGRWMWWGMADWSGLDIWSIKVWMIGCRPVEMRWWPGWNVEDLGSVCERWHEIAQVAAWVGTGQYSGMCWGTSYIDLIIMYTSAKQNFSYLLKLKYSTVELAGKKPRSNYHRLYDHKFSLQRRR